ncbi:MAG TPA: hypothetical protein VFN26_08370 [Candidatus Acidoferrum sp.]|nr:hypothetical protein [Candidatus Acidoferrum sp.]
MTENADSERSSQKKTGRPTMQPVYVNVEDPWSLVAGAFQFFAFLAYPAEKERSFRARFLHDLYSEMWKAHVKAGTAYVERIPKSHLRRTKRQVHGGLRLGFNRIGSRRLLAAVAAEPVFDGGRMVRRANPTTLGTTEMVREEPTTVAEVLRVLSRSKTLQKYGPSALSEMHELMGEVYGLVEARGRPAAEERARLDRLAQLKAEEDDQFQNFKRLAWHESLPVLHLAITLRKRLRVYKPDLPISVSGYLLLKDLSWVRADLEYADAWVLPKLRERIPEFDPAKAFRIIPVERIQTPTFNPTVRY